MDKPFREILSFFFIAIFLSTLVLVNEEEEQPNRQVQQPTTSLPQMLKTMPSLPTTFPLVASTYCNRIKTLMTQVQARLFPPNLDFRGKDGTEGNGGGTGNKLKEAVAKSLDQSKATMEKSAKSAAEMARETVQTAANKVEESLSENRAQL